MKALAAIVLLLIFVLSSCHGQVVFQATPQDVGVAEGGDAMFRCEATDNGSSVSTGWLLQPVMGMEASLTSGTVVFGIGSVMISNGSRNDLTLSSLSSSINGSNVTCLAAAASSLVLTGPAVITIYSTPSYSTLPDQPTTPLEGSSFNHSFSLSGDTSPSFNWTKDGVNASTDGRISTTASSIMIASVQRTDSGTYHVFGSNIAGTATASFVLDVIFPPEFSGLDNSQTDVLSSVSSFTFNCTPSAANPAPSFSFMRNGSTYTESAGNINGPVLTISSVVRADTGNYSCTATNTAGSTTLYYNLLVVEIPEYTTRNDQSPNANESVIPYTYKFDLNPGALPANFTWTKDGTSLSTDDSRFTLAVDSITIRNVNRSYSGNYSVRATNIAGMGSISFVLDVHYRPEFLNVPTMNLSQLNRESSFTLNCTPSAANPAPSFSFMRDGITYTEPAGNITGPVLTISSVFRADTGNYSCTATNTAGSTTLYHNLLVVAPPQYSLRANQSTTPLEGSDFTYQFNLDNGGVEPTSFTWSRAGTGGDLMNGNKYTLTADSITVKNVGRDDSGSFTVRATNMAGSHSISFTLDVQFPPEFTFSAVRSVQLNNGSQFTFNCRASVANPSSVDYSFHVNGSSQPFSVSGTDWAISSVVRADTGNYSCTATNTAGSTTLYYNLLVVAPPTSPRNLMVSGEMAFSAMVTWTPPTDDGGISHPSWASSSSPIQYTVTYSNSSGSWSINNLNTPIVTLSNLQHSTDYNVTVAASNAHGQSTGEQGTFRTLDSKPILHAVVLAPLSLNNFTANVTFLTVGGQDVTNFSIIINDSSPAVIASNSTPVPDGKGVMVSLLIEGGSFTKGTHYTVEITAANSVGTSEPITELMFVPNAPNVTGTFTDVSADSIPSTKCCAGVQLMLADRVVVSDLKVVLTPAVPSVSLELQDFTLYIGGVQAGTDYTAVVTIRNIFGSSDEQHLQLKPLLGVPSNPNPPTVSVNAYGGQVTVELSTAYPGTVQTRSDSMFRFEIQFIDNSQRSTRQSENVTHPVTPQNLATVRTSYVDNLDPGSYSVSVTAVNEHGRSSAVMSESTFTVTGGVIIIIAVVVVVVVLVLIVLIIAIICIICCMRAKKNKRKYPVESEDTELTTNRNAVEKNSLDGDRDSFMETGIYDEVGKETKKPPKPQSTPAASTTNGQPQPGGDIYAEVNKPKKTDKAAATPTTPPTGDVYAAVDMLKKTKKTEPEAPADKVDPEATLYAEVVQEKKEPAVPPKTEAEYQNPEVDKPIEENELQYASLDFSKAPSSFKKPAPPNPDENVIYSEVTIAKKH